VKVAVYAAASLTAGTAFPTATPTPAFATSCRSFMPSPTAKAAPSTMSSSRAGLLHWSCVHGSPPQKHLGLRVHFSDALMGQGKQPLCTMHLTTCAPCTSQPVHHAPHNLCTMHLTAFAPCTSQPLHHAPHNLCTMHLTAFAPCTSQPVHHAPHSLCTMHLITCAPCTSQTTCAPCTSQPLHHAPYNLCTLHLTTCASPRDSPRDPDAQAA